MVPLHESDVAENRWKEDEWKSFILWEKIEFLRKKKQKWIIFFVFLLFILLSSVPVLMDQRPKWEGLALMRRTASEINEAKLLAAKIREPVKIFFYQNQEGIFIDVSQVVSCEKSEVIQLLTQKKVASESQGALFQLFTQNQGQSLGSTQNRAVSFCYHPYESVAQREIFFGVIHVKDLTEGRTDRASLITLVGNSAEISFE